MVTRWAGCSRDMLMWNGEMGGAGRRVNSSVNICDRIDRDIDDDIGGS